MAAAEKEERRAAWQAGREADEDPALAPEEQRENWALMRYGPRTSRMRIRVPPRSAEIAVSSAARRKFAANWRYPAPSAAAPSAGKLEEYGESAHTAHAISEEIAEGRRVCRPAGRA